MKRQGSGFGFVVMLVILAVIFYLAMNNFKTVAPSALEVQKHNNARKAGREVRSEEIQENNPSTSASADSWNPSPPSRPSLSTMDQKTSEHTADVKDALSQAN
jgi:cytoskeletal protein RodZ